ncbi:flagellar biosynthetic protein FliR [Opitutales bacterium ASA1]|uniref:flagellar biosynthetic protein FliR n=1 Tax=Congregicoccus parvus TaxID=3081749 RepID=UPI002B28DFD4|nr:flagellar biosynthetic protein FliR [Opitutales bacterium ASA1]
MPVFAPAELFVWMLASTRATALLLILPFFLPRSVPRTLRIGFAAMLGWIVVPHAAGADLAMPTHGIEVVLLLLKELSIGLLMGLAVRMVFYVVEFAAQVLATEIGINPAPGFDPTAVTAGSPVGTGLFYLSVLIFFSGAHYAVLFAFARSFQLAPIGLQIPDTNFVEVVVRHSAGIFELGLLMAAPVIAVNFLINLVFSLLGRVVPKMNVFILSFSARIAAGLTMLALSVGLIVHYVVQQLSDAPEMMLRFIPFLHS